MVGRRGAVLYIDSLLTPAECDVTSPGDDAGCPFNTRRPFGLQACIGHLGVLFYVGHPVQNVFFQSYILPSTVLFAYHRNSHSKRLATNSGVRA